jgi:ankyrin repeat protein
MNKTKKKSNNKRKTCKKYLIKYAKNTRTRKSKTATKRIKIIGGSEEEIMEKRFEEIFKIIIDDETYNFEDIERLINEYKPILIYVSEKFGMRLIEIALALARKELVTYIMSIYPDIPNLKVKKTGGNLLSFYLASINPEINVFFHYDIFKLLVDKTENINDPDEHNNTAIFYAVYINNGYNLQCVDYLLQKGANINNKDEFNNTPLIYAIIKNDAEMVEFILKNGGKDTINDKNNDGKSALMVSVVHQYVDIVKLLLDNGAIVHQSILDYAKNINSELYFLLLNDSKKNSKKKSKKENTEIDAEELIRRQEKAQKEQEELLKQLEEEENKETNKKNKKAEKNAKRKAKEKKKRENKAAIMIQKIQTNNDTTPDIAMNETEFKKKIDDIKEELKGFGVEGFDVVEENDLKTELGFTGEYDDFTDTVVDDNVVDDNVVDDNVVDDNVVDDNVVDDSKLQQPIDEAEILNFWGSYFQDYDIQEFKNNIFLGFIHNKSSREFLQKMLPAYNNTFNNIIDNIDKNMDIDNILSALFIFIGFLSYHLKKQGIHLALKGGSAIQHIGSTLQYYQYTSNDIDVVLLSSPEGITKKEFAEKICKLIEWIMYYDDTKNASYKTNIDIDHPIYKIVLNKYRTSVIDIDYNDLENDIEHLYLDNNMFGTAFYIGDPDSYNYSENDTGNCLFYSQKHFSFIREKIYYLIKYTSGEEIKNTKNKGFLRKIHKSLKYFCLNQLQQYGYDEYDGWNQYWYYNNIFDEYFYVYERTIDEDRVRQLILFLINPIDNNTKGSWH